MVPGNLHDMKRLIFVFVLFLIVHDHATAAGRFNSVHFSLGGNLVSDSLPLVLTDNRADLLNRIPVRVSKTTNYFQTAG